MEIDKTDWMLCHLMSFCHIFFNLFNLWSDHHDILWWIMKDLNALLTSWCYGFLLFLKSLQFIRPYCNNWWNSFASSNWAIYVPMYHLVLSIHMIIMLISLHATHVLKMLGNVYLFNFYYIIIHRVCPLCRGDICASDSLPREN